MSLPLPSSTAPTAPKTPKTTTMHGHTRTDDYAWLRDDNWQAMMKDPSVLHADIRAHLEAENAYTKSGLAPLQALKDAIFAEMKGRIKDDDSSVPSPDGPYAYAHRYRAGDQHGIYQRYAFDAATRKTTGDPVTILDAETLAKDHGFFNLGDVSHSPDHSSAAYTVDVKGAEIFDIYRVDMKDGSITDCAIADCTGSVVWAQDNRTIFWVERDESNRPCRVMRRDIFKTKAKPVCVYDEKDPGFFVSVGTSDSERFIEISTHNHTTSEVWLIDANHPEDTPRLVAPRIDGQEYSLHESGAFMYILTNADGAVDFKIMRAPIASPEREYWQDFIPHTSGVLILGLEAYADHLVRLVRENALPRIILRDIQTDAEHDIAFDEEAYGLGLIGGYEFHTQWLRFAYSSPTTPQQVFDYNMQTRERVLLKTREVPSGHTPSDYVTRRLTLPARDGVDIPVTLIHRADVKAGGSAPLLLYGYGSYGITISAGFRTNLLSLVDRGFVYAIAHIRGGMAKGYQWYLDGKLAHKHRTFDDYVDVGRGLIDAGYTSEGRVIAHGGSAGGLLVGAALNQDPKLFGGVIGAVPFVDVVNTMCDETLPLTPPEWPEWGNPITDAEAYHRLLSYSPYDNIAARDYPPVLITAGLTDPRVTYWEPAKWAAKLREHQTGDAPIFLKTNVDAGHQGEAGRYDSLKETALEYAFACACVGAG